MKRFPSLKLTLLSFFVAFCSNWQYGYQTSYINTSVKTFYHHFNATYVADHPEVSHIPTPVWAVQWGLTVASFYVGAMIGFVFVPILTHRVGLKWSYIVSSVPALIGCAITFVGHWLATVVGSGSEESVFKDCLVFGRIFCGITGGAAVAVLPLWIRETSPPPYRGYISSFQQIGQELATVIGFIVGSESILGVDQHFEELQIIAAAPTAVLIILMLLLPDTPHYYFHTKNDWPTGEKSISFYYGKNTDIESATLAILQEWTEHSSSTKEGQRYKVATLLCPGRDAEARIVRKGFLIGALAAMSYGFTADDIIDAYSATIFEVMNYSPGTSGMDSVLASYFTIGLGCWILMCTVIASFLVDRVGRRKMIIAGLFGSAIGNTCTAIISKIPGDRLIVSYFVVGSVFFTKACIGLGAGPPAWFITSELVPAGARTPAQTLSTAVLLLVCGITTGSYLILQFSIGSLSFVVLAAAPAALIGLALLLYLPETKNKDIDEIQLQLGTGQRLFREGELLKGWSKRWKTYGAIPRHRKKKNKNPLIDSESLDDFSIV